MVTKQAAGSAKIDPVMAMFNATILMLANPEAAGQSDGSVIDVAEVLVFCCWGFCAHRQSLRLIVWLVSWAGWAGGHLLA
jgi:hypothetical protein